MPVGSVRGYGNRLDGFGDQFHYSEGFIGELGSGWDVNLLRETMCRLGSIPSLPLYLARSRNSPGLVDLGIPTRRSTGAWAHGELVEFAEFSNTPSRSR